MNMPFTNRELLARLIKCEAGGEGVNGMKAVATVVMNRVHAPYGEYQRVNQGDIRNVINQKGQFDCMYSTLAGRPNPQTIWSNPPEQIHYNIADWAIGGGELWVTGESLWYYNPFIPTCPNTFPRNGTGYWQTRLGEHCFYNPTAAYRLT